MRLPYCCLAGGGFFISCDYEPSSLSPLLNSRILSEAEVAVSYLSLPGVVSSSQTFIVLSFDTAGFDCSEFLRPSAGLEEAA